MSFIIARGLRAAQGGTDEKTGRKREEDKEREWEKKGRGEGAFGANRIKQKAPAPGIMGDKEGGDAR